MADIKTQSAEFDAVAVVARKYKILTMTAIVDDDYPEARHEFESALVALTEAMKANGRFEVGNRYKLAPV